MIKASKNQFEMQFGLKHVKNNLERGRGHFISYLWNRIQWNYFYRFNLMPRFPLNVDVEASSKCQIKCKHCFRQYIDIKDNGNMNWAVYKKIVDECGKHKLFTLKFSMRGEPLCHPQIAYMIAYAKERGIKEVWLNTNGGLLTGIKAAGLIRSDLDYFSMSFDGLYDAYEDIRRPLKYKDSLEKLKMFAAVRKGLKSKKPVIKVQTIWSAIKYDPDEYFRVMSPIVDKISYNVDFDYQDFNPVPDPDYVCYRLWQRLAITSNGDVLKCPSDFEKEQVLGNVKNRSIKSIWDNEQQKHREFHLAHGAANDPVCRKCYHTESQR